MSFKERRELDELPKRIEALEAARQELHETMADPAFYRRDGGEIAQAKARLASLEQELAQAYERLGGAGGSGGVDSPSTRHHGSLDARPLRRVILALH